MKKIISGTVAVFICLLILSSCSLDNNSGSTTTQQGAFLVAQISPDAPNLNITINGNPFDTGFIYGIYTPYIPANPGSYTFAFTASGSSSPSYSSTVNIDANKYYSYFLVDSFSKIKAAYVNDVFKTPAGDSSYIRFFNFCPNANGPISLYDSTHKVVLSSERAFNDQGFNPQYTAFNEVPSGTYILSLKTISGVVLKTQTVSLAGGKVYTLFAKGFNGSADTTKAISLGLMRNL